MNFGSLVGTCYGKMTIRSVVAEDATVVHGKDTQELRDSALRMMKTFAMGKSIEDKAAIIGGNRYVVKNGQFVEDKAKQTANNIPVVTVSHLVGTTGMIRCIECGHTDGILRLAWVIPGSGAVLIYPKGLRFAAKGEFVNLTTLADFNVNVWQLDDDELWKYMTSNPRWGGAQRAFAGSVLEKYSGEIHKVVTALECLSVSATPADKKLPVAPSTESQEDKKIVNGIQFFLEKECVVCLSEDTDCGFNPCHHACVCKGCADTIKTTRAICPLCRTFIVKVIPFPSDE